MKPTAEQSQRIQVLRGLAIIAVVFIHNTPGGLYQVFCRPFLNFSVGLFLFLSGMLSNSEHWNPWKRIKKVLIPYVIWTLIYSALYHLRSLEAIPSVFLSNLVTSKAAPMLYYVFVYCELTFLIPLIDKLARSRYRYVGFVVAPVEVVLMRTLPLVMGIELNSVVTSARTISCLGWFTYYYLGYLIGNHIIEVKIKAPSRLIGGGGTLILQLLEGYWFYTLGSTNCGTQLKISALLTGTIVLLLAYEYVVSQESNNLKVLQYVGDRSFGIYFSHIAIMYVLTRIPLYRLFVYPLNALVVIAVSVWAVTLGRKILGKLSWVLALY